MLRETTTTTPRDDEVGTKTHVIDLGRPATYSTDFTATSRSTPDKDDTSLFLRVDEVKDDGDDSSTSIQMAEVRQAATNGVSFNDNPTTEFSPHNNGQGIDVRRARVDSGDDSFSDDSASDSSQAAANARDIDDDNDSFSEDSDG